MKRLIASIIIFSFFASSCAYFNTFYNAKKYFNEAERSYQKNKKISPKERKEYQKVIEKCSKILEFYPNSKYVDDALYFMAISYLRLGNRAKAKRKFQELFKFFPNSKYIPEAKVEYARLLIESGNPEEARAILKQSSTTTLEDATLLLAHSLALEGKCDKALEELTPLLGNKKLEERDHIDALMLAAQCSYKTGDYQNTIKYLKELKKYVLPDSLKVQAQELIGDVYFKMDSLDKAQEVLSSIDLPPRDRRKPEIDFKIAKILLEKGDTTAAIKKFKKVYDEDKNGKYGQLAAFTIATIYENMDSVNVAVKWFQKASSSRANIEISDMARKRFTAYQEIEKYEKDTTDVRLKIAELFIFELNKPEKAVNIYRSVVDSSSSDDDLKRALYGLVYIYHEIYHNRDSTEKYFNMLKEKFDDSMVVKKAQSLIKSD